MVIGAHYEAPVISESTIPEVTTLDIANIGVVEVFREITAEK